MKKPLYIGVLALLTIIVGGCSHTHHSRGEIWNELEPYFECPTKWQGDMGQWNSPLIKSNGESIRSAEEWLQQRKEIRRRWDESMGQWPEMIYQPLERLDSTVIQGGITRYRVRLQWTPNEQTEGYLLIPPTKKALPAVITVFYEPETAVGLGGKPYRDFAIQLAQRGFVTLSLGTTETTRTRTYSIRYPAKGEESVEPLSMLAYAAANAYEALAMEPLVDKQRIGIVGHSYGGKWAMAASCLYEKFACAAWSDPGIVFAEDKGAMVNYWEPWYLGSLGTYERMKRSGHDLHEWHALMAPRPFLVSGGYSDEESQWRVLNHTIEVNNLLGYKHRVGMTNRKEHDPNMESNRIIYLFFEYFLKYRH